MLLKIAMFCVVGVLTGGAHWCLIGPPNLSPLVGILAGFGGVAYVELELHFRQRRWQSLQNENQGSGSEKQVRRDF